jgi:hypothetical protein
MINRKIIRGFRQISELKTPAKEVGRRQGEILAAGSEIIRNPQKTPIDSETILTCS